MPEPEENGIRFADRSASALGSSDSSDSLNKHPKGVLWDLPYARVSSDHQNISDTVHVFKPPHGAFRKIRQNSLLIKRPGSLL